MSSGAFTKKLIAELFVLSSVVNHFAIVRERADGDENYIAAKLRDIA